MLAQKFVPEPAVPRCDRPMPGRRRSQRGTAGSRLALLLASTLSVSTGFLKKTPPQRDALGPHPKNPSGALGGLSYLSRTPSNPRSGIPSSSLVDTVVPSALTVPSLSTDQVPYSVQWLKIRVP